ncbi:MAG: Mur ligase family protein [Patescibacteria group bacterium]
MTLQKLVQKVHFIGICGVAMSAVATALWQKGYKVTGSDAGFFPPISTYLTSLGIPYYSGWHPEKMIAIENGGKPDLVIVGNAVGSQNPEFLYVEKNKIPFKSYPEAIGEYLIKSHSIVCAGTYGKTTSSALLSHIFKCAGLKPSYMFGGLARDGSPAAVIDSSNWSIVEGDEYSTSKWDKHAKFFHYKPTHLLLTSVKWDHADLYPTEKSYIDAFRELMSLIPQNGTIVYCSDSLQVKNLVSKSELSKEKIISYGKKNTTGKENLYSYENIVQTTTGIMFDILCHDKTYKIESPLFGSYNAENITGSFAMAHEIGISPGDIIDAIKEFHGLKRRLEKRYENKVTVIDDIAHSPEKARFVLETLGNIYSGKIIAVYEPNSGNRTSKSKPQYKNAFKKADQVIIPRLTKLKIDQKNPEKIFEGEDLAHIIGKSQKNVLYINDDEELVKTIIENRSTGDVIVFLGSHGWRGMIEETVRKLAM